LGEVHTASHNGKIMENHQSLTGLTNREFFIRRVSQEYPAFVDVCKALPADKLDYRPHPGSRSAGELVAMLVSVQQSSIELCEKGSSSFNSGMQFHPSSSLATLDQMVAALEQHHRTFLQKLNGLDDTTWDRAAWLMQGKQEIIVRDTVGGLLWTALFDAVHHRGQLSTYIRPMGGKVPSIYGPSGDKPARP
jgi:uncharacterized damage-inducible protein DinB